MYSHRHYHVTTRWQHLCPLSLSTNEGPRNEPATTRRCVRAFNWLFVIGKSHLLRDRSPCNVYLRLKHNTLCIPRPSDKHGAEKSQPIQQGQSVFDRVTGRPRWELSGYKAGALTRESIVNYKLPFFAEESTVLRQADDKVVSTSSEVHGFSSAKRRKRGAQSEISQAESTLEGKDLWSCFYRLGTEMIITKTGRLVKTARISCCCWNEKKRRLSDILRGGESALKLPPGGNDPPFSNISPTNCAAQQGVIHKW